MKVALRFQQKNCCGRARRCVVTLPHGEVQTPTFMPVGTNGTVKGMTPSQIARIGFRLLLGNTYHLACRPGRGALQAAGSLHQFQQWPHNILTDSGGFQLVSLKHFSQVTEEGVVFTSTIDGSALTLTPEESVQEQNAIGADIIMALDDVVSATCPDKTRVEEATGRTTRWLKRCREAHQRPQEQALFGIVQGGLHADLRDVSLQELRELDLPGYAIGGLSGGESKGMFWRMVEQCSRPVSGLPEDKPRYLMGVGYPLDLVVCVALGVDLFDCVYPTRTARFGTALVPEGTLRLKGAKYGNDPRPIQEGCPCEACENYSRGFLHSTLFKSPAAVRLVTVHNLQYMWQLGADMRRAIEAGAFPDFVRQFLRLQFKSASLETAETLAIANDDEVASCPPAWVRDALLASGIDVSDMYDWSRAATEERCGQVPHDERPAAKRYRKS